MYPEVTPVSKMNLPVAYPKAIILANKLEVVFTKTDTKKINGGAHKAPPFILWTTLVVYNVLLSNEYAHVL